jgi:hypothetical protein
MKLGFVQCDPTYPQPDGRAPAPALPLNTTELHPRIQPPRCPEELNNTLVISLPNTTLSSGDEDKRTDISTMLALTVKADLEG